MFHSFGSTDQPWQRGSSSTRGVEVLGRIDSNKILWDLQAAQGDDACMASPLLQLARRVAVRPSVEVPSPSVPESPGRYIVEYGSSVAVAWVREDLVLLKAVSQLPSATGVVTLARGGISLEQCLLDTQASFPVLGGQGDLRILFDSDSLYGPASKAQLPTWNDLWGIYSQAGFSSSRDVINACYEVTADGSWFDFVAVYRYVINQYIRMLLGIRNEMLVAAGEDVFLTPQCIAEASITGFAEMVRKATQVSSWDRAPRVLNFPCQNWKQHCDHWHYVNARGRQVGYGLGNGADVPKKCRIRSPQHTTVEEVVGLGGGFSGMAIYYAAGVIGQQGDYIILARDYSKGQVYRVLKPFLQASDNGLRVIPYGATYLYGSGCDPKKSLDSLVLLEVLLRHDNPVCVLRKIFDALPVPYVSSHETYIELGLDRVTVTRTEV